MPQRGRNVRGRFSRNSERGGRGNYSGPNAAYGRGKPPKPSQGYPTHGPQGQQSHPFQQAPGSTLATQFTPGPPTYPWGSMQQNFPSYPTLNYSAPQTQFFGHASTPQMPQAGRGNNNRSNNFRGGRGNSGKRAKPQTKNNSQF